MHVFVGRKEGRRWERDGVSVFAYFSVHECVRACEHAGGRACIPACVCSKCTGTHIPCTNHKSFLMVRFELAHWYNYLRSSVTRHGIFIAQRNEHCGLLIR